MLSAEMLGNDSRVTGDWTTLLEDGRHKNNLPKQGDVIAKAIEPSVRVTNGQVCVDPGKEVIDRSVRQDICSIFEVIGTPHVDRETRVYRWSFVEDGIKGYERRPLFYRESNEILRPGRTWRFRN